MITHQPLPIIATVTVPQHRRTRITCVATCSESLALMEATGRDGETDYRMQWQHGSRRYHEVRERGIVDAWSKDHRAAPVVERLRELEAAADRFEPMDERIAA